MLHARLPARAERWHTAALQRQAMDKTRDNRKICPDSDSSEAIYLASLARLPGFVSPDAVRCMNRRRAKLAPATEFVYAAKLRLFAVATRRQRPLRYYAMSPVTP